MFYLKQVLFILLFLVCLSFSVEGQSFEVGSPHFALKTNALSWASGTFNAGGELRVSDRYTVSLFAGYNPWTFSDNKKWKHVSVLPELRYWTCSPFSGHFIGAHLLYSHYNASNLKLPFSLFPDLENERWEGDVYGVGLSYGYSFYVGPRWSLEATVGVGYAYLSYDRYECVECGEWLGSSSKHYFGPTKLGVSLIYLLK